ERTIWLGSRNICVPRILDQFHRDGFAAVLMGAVTGIPADRADAIRHIPRIAEAFRRLHGVPAEECPFDEAPGVRLARARRSGEDAAQSFLHAYGLAELDERKLWFFRDLYELF